MARIRAQTALLRPAEAGEVARIFHVALDAGPPSMGRVTIMRDNEPVGNRSVQGDTCSDVADAIALVVALAVDPSASPTSGAPTPASVLASASPPLPLPGPPPASPARAGAGAPRAVATARFEDRPARSVATGPAVRQAASVGADFAVAAGVAPNALLTGSPYVGWRANRSSWFDPSLRVAFLRAGTGAIDVSGTGNASFTLTVGQLDSCPVAWSRAAVHATACARIEAGALEVAGSNIVGAQQSLRPWVAAGPMARAEWLLARPFFLDMQGGALFRVIHDRFEFRPNIPVYQVPIVGFGAGAGLGIDLP